MTKTHNIDGYKVRVNTADYDEIVVERLLMHRGELRDRHVPAWDEIGFDELAGPFASAAEADRVCRELERFFS